MAYKISSEALGPLGIDGFANLVEQHITVLREYDAHEAVVRQHAADPDMKPEDRWTTLAVPKAPDEVEAAIRRTPKADGTTDFTADYEIIGPTLEQKKAKLCDLVSVAERDAIEKIIPARKVRAFQIREADILERQMIAGKNGYDGMDADERSFLARYRADKAEQNSIYRWAANLHSDIEDLTDATVDAFEVKPFHG